MGYDKEREAVKALYKWPSWAAKVDKMSDEQVMAIYLREKNKPSSKEK